MRFIRAAKGCAREDGIRSDTLRDELCVIKMLQEGYTAKINNQP
jgi:hypothetical protein